MVIFSVGDCCWVPCIITEHTIQPVQCHCCPQPALEGLVAMHNLSPVCGERANAVRGLQHFPCKQLCDTQTFLRSALPRAT